jgi:polysaccharide export outer membrane protein
LTRGQLEAALRARLVKSGIKDPQVAVLIRKMVSAKIAVYGEVRKPGTFTYEAGMTVVHAITLASGFVKTAQQDRVMVIHRNGERLEVPVRQIGLGRVPNVPLLPGDVVYVPESYF